MYMGAKLQNLEDPELERELERAHIHKQLSITRHLLVGVADLHLQTI